MSTKRQRVFRSSSTGEFGLMDRLKPLELPEARWTEKKSSAHAAPVNHPPKPVQPVMVAEQPRRSIFTLGSPIHKVHDASEKKVDERYSGFLQCCSHCKKKIQENEDAFMYGYLQAFCSTECREKQIALDQKNRKPSPEMAVSSRVKAAMPRVTGSLKMKKHSTAKFS